MLENYDVKIFTDKVEEGADEPRYPQFDIFINENIFFHTLVEAEAKIAKLVEDKELAEQRACFFVYEIPLGVNCYHTQGQEIRLYTADGKLNSQSKVSELEDFNGNLEIFPGREESECSFAVGDKVAVFWGDHFSIETIYALPVDSSFIEERFKDKSLSFNPDYSDDCYVTVPDGRDYYEHHNHPPVVNVFPIII